MIFFYSLYSFAYTFIFSCFIYIFQFVVWCVWAGSALSKHVEPPKVVSDEQLSASEMTLRIKLLQEDRYLVFTIALMFFKKKFCLLSWSCAKFLIANSSLLCYCLVTSKLSIYLLLSLLKMSLNSINSWS